MNDSGPLLLEGYRLLRHDSIGSTNDEAKALAHAGAAEGTLVWAGEQTNGRGRRGRLWLSPPGNLYLSLIMRPAVAPARAAQLGFVAALALADGIGALCGPGIEIRCKWPNDILAAGRKLAGILLESEIADNDMIDFVVIGTGANLVSYPSDVEYPATSLAVQGFAGIAPEQLLQAYVQRFDSWARIWREEGFAPIREAWLARAAGLGEEIQVRLERTTLFGRFLDLDEDGSLVIETTNGRRRIAAGEVFPASGSLAFG
jgi:BirA family transcriptional regulator, biotin operon repressor / biotin---[acetyl-CoA-carboxylase] ligase